VLSVPFGGGTALAQATASDAGTISGVVHLATPNRELGPVSAQLITLREGADPEATLQDVAADGTFEFEVDADPELTYIVRVRYEDIQYFSSPLLLSPELPSSSVDFEVFATSSEPPALTIDSTTVTVLAIDRERAELTLVREDLVQHDEPIIFVGDADRITLRIPVPDGTIDAGGFDDTEAEYGFDGGTISVSAPLRPGVTSIVTRYTVRYEADEDEYRLRITSPLPADHIEIRVPERFLREVQPQGATGLRGDDDTFEGEPLTVIERTVPANSGEGLVESTRTAAEHRRARSPADGLRGTLAAGEPPILRAVVRGARTRGPDRGDAARGRAVATPHRADPGVFAGLPPAAGDRSRDPSPTEGDAPR
jgi:hypothetical protein